MSKSPNALVWLLLSWLHHHCSTCGPRRCALAHLLHEPVPVIDGLLNLTLVYNEGAAFSFLSDAGGWQRWFFSHHCIRGERVAGGLAGAHTTQ
jgi:signal peptidase II